MSPLEAPEGVLSTSEITGVEQKEPVHRCPDDGLAIRAIEALALEAAWHLAMITTCYTRAIHPEDDEQMRNWMVNSWAHEAAGYAYKVRAHLAVANAIHSSGVAAWSHTNDMTKSETGRVAAEREDQ